MGRLAGGHGHDLALRVGSGLDRHGVGASRTSSSRHRARLCSTIASPGCKRAACVASNSTPRRQASRSMTALASRANGRWPAGNTLGCKSRNRPMRVFVRGRRRTPRLSPRSTPRRSGSRAKSWRRHWPAQSRLALVLETALGRVAGYGFIRPGSQAAYLGPIVASSDEVGLQIVQALLANTLAKEFSGTSPMPTPPRWTGRASMASSGNGC